MLNVTDDQLLNDIDNLDDDQRTEYANRMILKTCPFCGKDPEFIKSKRQGYVYWGIRCYHCEFTMGTHCDKITTVTVWNDRI